MDDLKKAYRTVMDDHFPLEITISFGDQKLVYRKRTWKIVDKSKGEVIEKGLRYGENPGQEAAMYQLVNGNLILGDCRFIDPGNGLVSAITEDDMLQAGKHPGKTNMTDLDNGLNIIKFLDKKPCAVILKHNNPCGAATGISIDDAYNKADMADRIAAFGGCLVANRPVNRITAEMVSRNYLEVVAAPDFEEGALEILKKRANLRIVRISRIERLSEYCNKRFVDFKSLIDGGLIVQQSPVNRILDINDFQPATAENNGKKYQCEREPDTKELDDMLFGWSIEQGVTSNSVIYVKDGVTVGIGTGEQDRVGVAEIAVQKAYTKYMDALCFNEYGIAYKELELQIANGEKHKGLLEALQEQTKKEKAGLTGSAMISDAFFPFRDGVDVGISQGVISIVQPGGSMRDYEIIEACNTAVPKVAMLFTGQRAFRH